MINNNLNTDADALKLLIDTGRALGEVHSPIALRPHAVLPTGYQVVTVPQGLYMDPISIEQEVCVFNAPSFVSYFLDYCNQDSRIFVDIQQQSIVGILDYHNKTRSTESPTVSEAGQIPATSPAPRWGKHILRFIFRETTAWTAWTKLNGTHQNQDDFGDFLEEQAGRIDPIVRPAIIDFARGVQAHSSATVATSARKPNGGSTISFSNEVNGKTMGGVEIPESFLVSLVPFEGTSAVDVKCLLKYTIDTTKRPPLTLLYRMLNLADIKEQAVVDIMNILQTSIPNTFTLGTPAPLKK